LEAHDVGRAIARELHGHQRERQAENAQGHGQPPVRARTDQPRPDRDQRARHQQCRGRQQREQVARVGGREREQAQQHAAHERDGQRPCVLAPAAQDGASAQPQAVQDERRPRPALGQQIARVLHDRLLAVRDQGHAADILRVGGEELRAERVEVVRDPGQDRQRQQR
jgi:hypothetical protein